jgi:AbiV family abortive infection protein
VADRRADQWRKASKPALLKGMRLCLANATRLFKSARILHNSGANNAAFVFGVLALEEAGKVVYLTILSHSDRNSLSDKAANNLHGYFFNHSTKAQMALHGSWMSVLYVRRRKHVRITPTVDTHRRKALRAYRAVGDFIEKTPGAEDIAGMKLLALYVGSRNDVLAEPPRVPPAVAASLIMIVGGIIRDARRLRDTFRRSRTDKLADSIIAVMFKRQLLHAMYKALQSPQQP